MSLRHRQPRGTYPPEETHGERFGKMQKSIKALEGFLKTVNARYTKSGDLLGVMKDYDSAGELDDRIVELEKELLEIGEQMKEEGQNVAPKTHDDLGYRMSVGVVAESEAERSSASWRAAYDIRVDTSGKSNPVKLIYKAVITNSTRESWDNVPLTLETATPTFGVDLPSLEKWTLSVCQPTYYRVSKRAKGIASPQGSGMPVFGSKVGRYDPTIEDSCAPMPYSMSEVTSKGTINATFRVPGIVTIPADSEEHTFTTRLECCDDLIINSAPKVDTRVSSQGQNQERFRVHSSSRKCERRASTVPLAWTNPSELHTTPFFKKATTSGFYNKSSSHVYTQRMTVHNTKNISIPLLKVVDQIPVSEDSSISVKLLSPALKLPSNDKITTNVAENHGTPRR
ncbi:hypothetical protein L218DRAFT_1004511 [Marasmius fiardii PR-910]|nr:hypothetical protein L218DRAFT_1004511 [Marasmius fiardii PR-910]